MKRTVFLSGKKVLFAFFTHYYYFFLSHRSTKASFALKYGIEINIKMEILNCFVKNLQ
jgi:hypothetical protein